MDEAEVIKVDPPKDPTLALFLGLYLILLAFFVLLNTMATLKDDRVKAVLGSLLSTFSTEILNTSAPTEFTASVGDILATDEYHREIRDFFEVAVPLSRVEFYSAGTVMQIRVPANQVFETGSMIIRKDRNELVDRVARAMSRRVQGLRYDLEFSTFTGPFLAPPSNSGPILAVVRSGAFARDLVNRGIAPEALTIGAQPGNPAELQMTFLVRIVDQARVHFAE